MSDDERLRLIFRAGVSTAEVVTQLSGRGVGMDVVASVMQRHRGRVDVSSEPGRGTRFELRFPVLFRWEEYLVVEVDRRAIGLPVRRVERALPALSGPPGSASIELDGEVLPIVGVRELDPRLGELEGRAGALVAVGERRGVFVADRLTGFTATLVQALPGKEPRRWLAGVGQAADGGVLWGIDLDEVAREWERYALA